MRTRIAAATALLLAAVTGCAPTASGIPGGGDSQPPATAAAYLGSPIGYGPGPQAHYKVQPQPAPGSCHYGSQDGEPLPDPRCTPGALSPAVTQADLASTICRKGGYAKLVRPPLSVTVKEKKADALAYGYTGIFKDADYDHLVSLELGGDPNDPRNLWVERPSPGHRPDSGPANPKDAVEATLHDAVCSGRITLAAAQRAIAADWVSADASLGLPTEGDSN